MPKAASRENSRAKVTRTMTQTSSRTWQRRPQSSTSRIASARRATAMRRVRRIDKTKRTSTASATSITREKSLKKEQKKEALKMLEKSLQSLKDKFLLSPMSASIEQRIGYILRHERHKYIKLCGKAFRVGEEGHTKVYSGLTKKLHRIFYPDTEEDPYKKSPEEIKRRKPINNVGKLKKACRLSGAAHGTKVHGQIQRFVKSFIKRKTKVRVPVTTDPCALRILNLFVTKQWIPVCSELPIYNEDWSIGTQIDIIILDVSNPDPKKHRIKLGELKTGHEGEEYSHIPSDGYMRPPLGKVKNCPMHRHLLQTISMLMILKLKYGIIMDEALIIRSCARARGVMLIGLPTWAQDPTLHTYMNSAFRANVNS